MKTYLIQVHEYNTYKVKAKNEEEAIDEFHNGNYEPCYQDDDGNQEIEKITEEIKE